MTPPRVNYVVLRHAHHSPHSGYSRVAEYGADRYGYGVIKAKPLSKKIIRNRIMWRVANGVMGYDRSSMGAELSTAWQILRERNRVFHILYGENTYHYLGALNNFRRNRIVATFHQPPDIIPQIVRVDWHIRQLSAVICVGSTQRDYFAQFLEPEKVFNIPLGIDTEFFRPPDDFDERDPNLCLFVGDHLRDFPTLRGVIELTTHQNPDLRFVVVTRKKSFDRIGQHPKLQLLSGISEADLLELYRRAAVMVTPMLDSTSNNALLEALACGLPMVVTDVGAVRDYVNPESAAFVPFGDSRQMAEETLRLLDDENKRKAMSAAARIQANQFAWPKVIEQLHLVYSTVA